MRTDAAEMERFWASKRHALSTFVVAGVGCLALGNGLAFGFTPSTGVIAALAVGATIVAILDRRCYWIPRLGMSLMVAYACLVACDLLASQFIGGNPNLRLKGLYTADREVGYRLTPAWSGVYDDGFVEAKYEVNSHGHRDDELPADGRVRAVLLGDSFAFGALLDQSQTIDKQLEQQLFTGAVHNLGVGGYGPPGVLNSYERLQEVRSDFVFYLFYNNDLRADNLLPDHGVTVVDGFTVPSTNEQGERRTMDELKELTRAKEQQARDCESPGFTSCLQLATLRYRILPKIVRKLSATKANPEGSIGKALSYVDRMNKLAEARGAKFAVVIIPTRAEAYAGEYGELNKRYMAALQEAGHATIPLIGDCTFDDYFRHDGHFNPSGAGKTATAIAEYIQNDPAPTAVADNDERPQRSSRRR